MKNSIKISGSLFFVVLVAFATYHFFISKIESKDREIASFGERNSAQQIKWEQNLAKDLAAGQTRAQMPSNVSWQDAFVYEYLKGQYSVTMKQGFIHMIKLQDQQLGLELDISKFMNEYAHNIKDFSKFEVINTDTNSEKIELTDSKGQNVGSFLFNKNDQGRVTEILVQ